LEPRDFASGSLPEVCRSLAIKEKQCFPVEKNTSMEGRFLHFIPKSEQDLGKEVSQVIPKCLHLKQSGARSGIFEESLFIRI